MSVENSNNIFSVSEISAQIKNKLERNFGYVQIKGEVSSFKRHSSGHLYFNLKDESAVISAICWRGNASKIKIQPEEGLEVICFGKITTYQGRSQYQIIVEKMEASGEGALLKLLMERTEKLRKEGLFDLSRKRKLPLIPEKIGVITSPTGAVIRDILHRITDRFPRHLFLWPAPVQGDTAAAKIVEAINGFNKIKDPSLKPNVIIIARGGGSFEDLWPFNDEELARAIANSQIPVISAVGHETDTTLADYAADVRAPTPTAAAEMVVPVRLELLSLVKTLENRKIQAVNKIIFDRYNNVKNIARALPKPQYLISELYQQLDDRMERMENAIKVFFERKDTDIFRLKSSIVSPVNIISTEGMKLKQIEFELRSILKNSIQEKSGEIHKLGAELENCSFINILKRGFVLAKNTKNSPIISGEDAKKQPEIRLTFYDSCVTVTPKKTAKAKNKKEPESNDSKQRELF